MKVILGIILFVSSATALLAQNKIYVQSNDSTEKITLITTRYIVSPNFYRPIYCGTNYSDSCNIYENLDNQIRFQISGIKNRDIFIEHNYDSNSIVVSEIWRPISKYLVCEYTLMTAIDSGAYDETESTISKRHIDNESIYWVREFSIIPTLVQDFTFNVFIETDSANILANTIKLKTYPYPQPKFNIEFQNGFSTKRELLALDTIKISNLSDFKKASDWYGIQQYTLSIYNHSPIAIYRQTVRSSIFPFEAKPYIRKLKKGGVVVFENLITEKEIIPFIKVEIK